MIDTNIVIDLTNCEKEPIHVPGFIQSHGFLAAIDPVTFIINQVSENIEFFLEKVPARVLGKKIHELFDPFNASLIGDLLNEGVRNNNLESQNPTWIRLLNRRFDLVIHAGTDHIILEFECRDSMAETITPLKWMTGNVSKIQSALSTQMMLDRMAGLVKEISGYDRVMIYKFHPDQHGEVMSESKNQGLPSFLHLHYPASDIPAQAREIYKLNLVRLIADVHANPSPLIGIDADNMKPLDLTQSVLRAVSPIHITYLKNMGVCSSFSISLMYKKALWGLIACHNYELKPPLDYSSRMASRFIGELFSVSLEQRMDEDMREENDRYGRVVQTLHEQMLEDLNVPEALTGRSVNLLAVNAAAGAAMYFEENWYLLGHTPPIENMLEILQHLKTMSVSGIYETAALPTDFETAMAYAALASGIMVAEITPPLNEWIIWFKPEITHTIDWAGDPTKPVSLAEDGTQRLSPRKSFDKWSSDVKYTSQAWSGAELKAAGKLRENVVGILNKKSTEIRKRHELMRIAYDELDAFSYTISHDLKSPLAAIKNYTELILEDHGKSITADAIALLQKVIGGADNMERLINNVLRYSQVGRSGIEPQAIDMPSLLNRVIEEVLSGSANKNTNFRVISALNVLGDPTMITQVFQNLVGNAAKYAGLQQSPLIEISAQQYQQNQVLYTISDNGIGFDMQHAERIFELFQRLDNVDGIEGTGVGLAIVKRMVEKNGGKIWAKSTPGQGAAFYLTLPMEIPA